MDAINLEQVLSTAAVSSALTAASLLTYIKAFGTPNASNAADNNTKDSQPPPLPVQPPVPTSISELWSTAWAAFDVDTEESNSSGSNISSIDGSLATEPISQPLLWLQGIRLDARRVVLSLSLSTLQHQINSLPLDASTVTSSESWPRMSRELLASCTVAVAQTWLGYVPSALQNACYAQLEGNSDTQKDDASQESKDNDDDEEERKNVWYALEERLQLYCSVLRLLRSQLEVALEEEEAVIEKSLDNNTIKEQQLVVSEAFNRNLAVRGWRATEAGTRSSSQLLSLAPSILQDMAVTIADAVAGAYLAEASQGSWQPTTQTPLYKESEPLINYKEDGGSVSKYIPTASNRSVSYKSALGSMPVSIQQPQTMQNDETMNLQRSIPSKALETSYWPAYVHPRLSSTRQLQRFSNRLAAARWADRTFFSVAAAYEDRLPLFTLVAPAAALRVRRVPVRRTAEISGLTGLRYATSLVLEAVDMAAPLLRMLWQRAVSAAAWLLVNGVGWALGLVWRGIKMGARGVGNRNSNNNTNQQSGQSNDPRKQQEGGVEGGGASAVWAAAAAGA